MGNATIETIHISRFTKGILGILGAAFLSWAGVVWQTGAEVAAAAQDVRERLAALEGKIEGYQLHLIAHEKQPWHEEAGRRIERIESKPENQKPYWPGT